MKKNTFLICSIILFASLNLKSQVASSYKEKLEAKSPSEFKQTIQIIFLVSENPQPIALTVDLINTIESLRQENEITYLDIDKGCKIKILPNSLINQINFKPEEEYIVVEKFDAK